MSTGHSDVNLLLTAQERTALLSLLENTVKDARVEERRTEAPDYHDMMKQRVALLQGLVDKVRRL